MEPRMINLNAREYKNMDATERTIQYITRTRNNETEEKRNELLLWGNNVGYHNFKSVECIIQEFNFIQRNYITDGTRICHYVIQIDSEAYQKLDRNIYRLADYGVACCRYLYDIGHQSCFAIHCSKKDGLHIHVVINNINYITGKPLNQFPKDIYKTIERPLLDIFNQYIYVNTDFSRIYNTIL